MKASERFSFNVSFLLQVQKVENCFELYGFDVLVDENIKPWLLEVNFSPSLGSDCQADIIAKKPMLHDLLDLLHFKGKDAERGGEDFKHYYKTFSGRMAYRLRGSTEQKDAGHGKRASRPGAQGGKPNRQDVPGSRANSSTQRADASFGLPLADPVRVYQENNLGNENERGETPCAMSQQRDEFVDGDRNRNCDAVHMASVPATGRGCTDEVFDSSMLVDPDEHSFQLSHLNKDQSKTTISADSHNSRGSGDSKVSKASVDSGIASASKSARSSAKGLHSSSVFGSLPEVLSCSRRGSGINGRDIWCKDDASLHFPSLENSASSKTSKRSQKIILTPTSTANSTDGYPDQLESNSIEHDNPSQTRSRSVSRKSLLSISNGHISHRRHRSEDSNPVTHRSVASVSMSSVQPGERTILRRSLPQRNQSSMSFDPRAPTKSRFMQPHPRQQKFYQQKSSQQGGFASLKKRVGNFYLVFPFNEVTHKVSLSTLDAKVVIRETQRFVREALNPTVSNSMSGADQNGLSEGLWAPLRVAKDD